MKAHGQVANTGSRTLKYHPKNCSLGFGKASSSRAQASACCLFPPNHGRAGPRWGFVESRWRTEALDPVALSLYPPAPPPPAPSKCQGCLQNSPHTLFREKGPTSLPQVSGSDIKAQAPGPSELLKL